MRRLIVPCAMVLALCAPALAEAKPALGIADNKASTFDDARYKALHIKYVRTNLPWDLLKDEERLTRADAWFKGAKTTGAKALVSFDRSGERPSYNPTPAELAAALKAWRKRWPGQISEISAWNEPNINGKKPDRVAKWWRALRLACPTCTVLPGELVDKSNAVKWAKDFIKAAKRQPAVWAMHAYLDANNFTTKNTRAFLKAVKGKVWLTETGGVVERFGGVSRFAGKGVSHQTKATDFLLNKLMKIDPRMGRVYIYSWSSLGDDFWDSGLIGPDNSGRPALNLVRRYLGLGPADLRAPAQDPAAA